MKSGDMSTMAELREKSLVAEDLKRRQPTGVAPLNGDDGSASQKTIAEIFEAQVQRIPRSVAVEDGGAMLSYEELNQRANQLGHNLRRLGVGPDVLVGIHMKRSVEMVVGLLGILKAGGAYVPLDANYPEERLRYMIKDAGVRIVITDKSAEEVQGTEGVMLLRLHVEAEQIARESRENLATKIWPETVAYVIYTSGSTGIPKGVSVSHAGLSNYLYWALAAYLQGSNKMTPVHSPLSFDLTVTSLYAPLLAGHSVKLIAEGKEIEGLEEILAGNDGWGLVKLTPSHLRVLAQTLGEEAEIKGNGSLVIGGEALRWGDLVYWQQRGPELRLINEYGPTETVVGCCVYEAVAGEGKDESSGVPIGRPITNAQMYILGPEMELLPPAAKGEIYIGGAGLGRGYVNRADLTGERFVPDPFGGIAGSRLYRTGDLGRLREDHNIEYLGRADEQVKIFGYRIELGEIEVVLEQHPGVRQAAAMVREDTPGDKRLVAYIVERAEKRATVADLREFLRKKLPEYMIPSAMISMDVFPLTTNGKVDRQALPAPGKQRPALIQPYIEPETNTQKLLASIWAEILRIDRVGARDDFFDLGGNSLLAGQVLSRAGRICHQLLPLRTFFENPVLSDLARCFETAQGRMPDSDIPPLTAAARGEKVPLGFSQERVYFLCSLNPDNLSYNFQALLRFHGKLSVVLLERALTEIVRRHEIFRTTFHEEQGSLVQVVHPPFPVTLTVVDVESSADPDGSAQAAIEAELPKRFDLAQLPLIYWVLIRISSERHVLFHKEHHLIHDGWSFNLFLHELFELYRDWHNGSPSRLHPFPTQFADFAIWQRQWMETEEAARELNYWKEKLAGAPELLVLPWDHPRPSQPSHRGELFRIELALDLCRALREQAHTHKITLFMAMLAAFAALLRRLSGEADICIGSGVAGRNREETHSLIGMLVNNAVFRLDLSSNPKVGELFEQVRGVTVQGYDNQDIPFDRVVDAVHPKRSMSYQPLYQVMFSFHDSPLSSLDLPGCQVRLTEGIGNHSAKLDLNIIVIPRGQPQKEHETGSDGITLNWEYSSDLFDSATMQHWIAAYRDLLSAIASDLDQRIDDLPLLSAEQRHQLIDVEVPATIPSQPTIHELFEAVVQQQPGATAAVWGDRQIIYEDLNKQANQVAHLLIKEGAGPEGRVGICLEPSLEMVIGILGILKAGAAYVPMDPNYPTERLAYVMKDAGISLLLTQRELETVLPRNNVRWIRLDDSQALQREETNNPARSASSQNLAYVIYTSGSTGLPKGVEVTHGNVTRLFEQTEPWFNFNADDVWTLFHSFAFDFSVWELWGALCYGGRVVIVPRWIARSSEEFYDLLASEQVTVLNQTPSAFQQLIRTEELRVEAGQQPELALRFVIFGAEALDFQSLQPWIKRHKQQPRLINMYGITETTVHVTYCPVDSADPDERIVGSRIGIPIGDLRAYVLDDRGRPVPAGGRGELHVAGKGLARGYHNRPDLTAERFVPDPFSCHPGDRMYCSGDMARIRGDGTLEYLGRIDRQVKIRGYRIELGEIEARLMEHADLQEAVVIVREDIPGEKRLVAYYTGAAKVDEPSPAQDEGRVGAEQLRKYLVGKLPEYMVPAAYVYLESMPLTVNGKLDRKALPAPEGSAYVACGYEAPHGEVERELAAIWADVIKREKVGRHDNFFELGGHSLMAMRIVARASATFGVIIPVRLLFETATICAFGEAIRELATSRHIQQDMQILRIPREGKLPLSFNQEGRLLVEWWAEMHSAPYAPFQFYVAFSLGPEISIVALERALNVLAARHEILRTTFSDPKRMQLSQLPPEIASLLSRIKAGERITAQEMHGFVNRLLFGPSIFDQTIHPEVTLNVVQLDFSGFNPANTESEILRIATEAIETPFDYERPPLMRILLFKKSSSEQLLLLVMPHLLGDAWSLEVFRRELVQLYEAFVLGGPLSLPELPIQSVDFAAWQRKQLQGAYLDELASYWKQRWSEFSLLDVKHLSFAKPSPKSFEFTAETIWQTVDRPLSAALRALLRHKNITLHMLWLTALNILLHLYTHKERIGMWGLFANRIHPETENLMGWISNGHIIGVQVTPDQEAGSLLAHVRDVVLEAHSYQDIPLALLWHHFMKDLESNPGSRRAPVQPYISFVTETQTASGLNALIDEAKFPYRIGRLALKLVVVDSRDDIQLFIRYAADRFSAESICRMMADWQQIVQKIIDIPSAKVSEFAAVLQPPDPADFPLAS